jgi:hypothetical protein
MIDIDPVERFVADLSAQKRILRRCPADGNLGAGVWDGNGLA